MTLPPDLSAYRSASQQARVFSEWWVAEHFKCLRCSASLVQTARNTAARDFDCPDCGDGFELKSKKGAFGGFVVDGAYASMLESIRSASRPHLLLLSYTPEFKVRELVAVPRQFVVEEIVVPRRPLGPHCRRAGWQGCNLRIELLPSDGKLVCVKDFQPVRAEELVAQWRRAQFLESQAGSQRGWLAVTMGLIRRLQKQRFQLEELYQLEHVAGEVFPGNRNVRAKIRQQLQVLRDQGWLEFESRGQYRIMQGREVE